MPERSLPERLLALPAFQRRLKSITLRSVRAQFASLEPTTDWAQEDLNYLLSCATVLARSEHAASQDAALRIAQYVLGTTDSGDAHRLAAAVVLDMMTNRPAIDLAIERNLLRREFLSDLPAPLRLDALRRNIRYSVLESGAETLQSLNSFQLTVYRAIAEGSWVSISAPTSAGKSFVLLRSVTAMLRDGSARVVVFIVPTRALIQQLELDINAVLGSQTHSKVFVSSLPRLPRDWRACSLVFVFTQERLHWLMTEAPRDLSIDLVVVDEAHKLGDGARGVLLEDVLAETSRRFPNVRFLFSSPMTSNPELLLKDAPTTGARTPRPITSEQTVVNQNLIWASQIPYRPTEWVTELVHGDDRIPLGTFQLSNRPAPISKRLPMVAHALAGGAPGNLIYVNGPADSEKAAQILWSLQGSENDSDDPEIAALVDLTRKLVHKAYALATVLSRKVAFHYGNMPLLLRSEIERLFKSGKVHFLVCTPTLIEGVNLPARTIFLRGPQRGRGKPMGEMDFWNLAGRAGRQGKEFQGNVVCIDPTDTSVWRVAPPIARTRYAIVRRLDQLAEGDGADLLRYVSADTPRGTDKKNQELEYAFVYFMMEQSRHQSLADSPALSGRFTREFLRRMSAVCDSVWHRVEVTPELVARHPGVSPIAMQTLLNHLRATENKAQLVPAPPESHDAVSAYKEIITCISAYLSGDPEGLSYPRAILVVNWMRGYTLARLIADSWAYWQPRDGVLANVIRDTMKEVEEYVRFRFAKYAACYVDVLRIALSGSDQLALLDNVHDLRLSLEFGASHGTQLSLMGLGLSRTSAIALSELIAQDDLDEDGCLTALHALVLESHSLSPIVMEEVRRVRQRMLPSGQASA